MAVTQAQLDETRAKCQTALDLIIAAGGTLASPPPPPVIVPPSVSVPAWRRGLPRDVLFAIPGTANSPLMPPLVVDCYAGFAIINGCIYYPIASGHWSNLDFRNEVEKLSLLLDQPAYSIDCVRSPPSMIPDPTTKPLWMLDNKPWPRQTYNSPQPVAGKFLPDGKDRIFLMGAPVCAVPSGMNPYTGFTVSGYRVADQAWDAPGTWDDIILRDWGANNWSFGADPDTGMIYYGNGMLPPNGGISRFKPMAPKGQQHESLWPGPVTGVPNNWTGWQFRGLAKDRKRNRIGVFGIGSNVPRLEWLNLATNAFETTVITGGMAGNAGSGTSAVYDPDGDRLLCAPMGNGPIWQVNPDSGASSLLCTAPAPATGINNRWGYVEGLGGVVWHSKVADPVMFLPTQDM